MQEAASKETSQEETCGEHEDDYSFWCESCDVPACRKCLLLKHKVCELVLIEDKRKLQEQQQDNFLLLKKKVEKYCGDLTVNNENLASVRALVEKLQSVERKMLDYQTDVKAWKTEALKLLSYPSKISSALSKITKEQDSEQKNAPVLEELEEKIRSRPSPLLVHMAASYQISGEDVDALVVALRSSVEARWAEGPSGNEDLQAEGSKQSFLEAVAALVEGKDWVVSDSTSAAAVQNVLGTTSVRPAKVQIVSNNIPDELLLDLKSFFNCNKKYPVEASETLPSFPDSQTPCSETRAYSTARLYAWTAPSSWCSLTQFWGHLDAAAVLKLPATIKSVGLVLRDQDDMAAVNALWIAAVVSRKYASGRSGLKWGAWTDLDLSVAKTFRPDHWMLSWCWLDARSNLPIASYQFSVRFRLHLPQLVPGNRRWMGDLFRVMELKGGYQGKPIPLLLPGAHIDPNRLLGELRDSGQCWEVHLPGSMPQHVARKEVAERYIEFGHSVTWDLE